MLDALFAFADRGSSEQSIAKKLNQIQEFHDQNDDEEKKWHTIMKLQEIRTTNQDLEIRDPSTEPRK
jgi:hypothetical protein